MASSVIGALRVMLGMDTAEFEAGSDKAQREARRLERSMRRTGTRLQSIGKTMSLALTLPLAAFGASSFKAASDAAELQSAFEQTFGALSKEMNDWAVATGDSMGRSTQAMQEMANTFGIFFNQAAPTRKEAAEMSKTFAVLAQDLASFYNVSESDALQKLRSGLSGEAEPMRDFGVFLSAAAVEAKAMEMGLADASGEISEQSKILARYQLILEGTTNAQGDVMRTGEGTANQMRRASAAFEEMQVAIGNVLLPVLTPLIEGLGKFADMIGQLPSGAQTAIVVIGGLAAAIGPLLIAMGAIVTALPAVAGAFAALSVPLAPLVAIVAGVAAAGYLIYQNWDKIAPVFDRLKTAFEEALGPRIQAAFERIREVATDLWEGPFGDGIRTAMDYIGQFQAVYFEVLGTALVKTLSVAVELVAGAFEQIGNAIDLVVAVLTRDWKGAWSAVVSIVTTSLDVLVRVVDAVFPGFEKTVRQTITGITQWFYKLGDPFQWVADKLTWVGRMFFELYDKVVGHSYIPDMVDGIAAEMARLDGVMVDPARKATQSVNDAMRDMAQKTQALLARLFPEVEKARQMAADLATIEASSLSASDQSRARRRLRDEYYGGPLPVATVPLDVPQILDIPKVAKTAADQTEVQTVRIAQSFKDMADRTMAAVRDMSSAIKGGSFLDILSAAVGLFTQIGSTGLFGSGIANFLNSSRGVGGVPGFANGGSMRLGGVSGVDRNLLSLNGAPLARVTRNETLSIRPANDNPSLNVTVTMDPSTGALGAFVRDQSGRVVAQATPSIVKAGAAYTMSQAKKSNRRSLR